MGLCFRPLQLLGLLSLYYLRAGKQCWLSFFSQQACCLVRGLFEFICKYDAFNSLSEPIAWAFRYIAQGLLDLEVLEGGLLIL